jgi:hypothetical protein
MLHDREQDYTREHLLNGCHQRVKHMLLAGNLRLASALQGNVSTTSVILGDVYS